MNDSRHVDVLIVGAGLSGIGAAVHLQTESPGSSYAVLEMREAMGGTWDLFRYPGVRSDSDMFTLGYRFRPWPGHKSIADGSDILDYIRTTAEQHGLEQSVHYRTKVTDAAWSTDDEVWTITTQDTASGQESTWTAGFLYLCSGYYDYDSGYTPDFAGTDEFAGRLVHPQFWPEDLDVAGKQVVVIGSGATAVTLIPAMVQQTGVQGHVTMLQRSPSYLMPFPAKDPIDQVLKKVLPTATVNRLIRWKNIKTATLSFQLAQRYPKATRRYLRKLAVARLPKGFDVDTHFNPSYDPWDQRVCLIPDGDFFAAVRRGRASVVTDHVDRFTAKGILLRSGQELAADVIVTATGLNLKPLGGLELTVDGEKVVFAERFAYKGMMLAGVPNLAFAIGYTNASWTLKVDLVSSFVARLVRTLRERGEKVVTPLRPSGMDATPFIEMSSGYFERSRESLPLQGDRAPWRLEQHYGKDAPLFADVLGDGVLRLGPAERGEAEDAALTD